MKTFLLLTFFLALLCKFTQNQQCLRDSGESQLDSLQTGAYTIVNQNYQRVPATVQETCYDVPLSYSPASGRSFQLILSPIQISSQQSFNTDFAIRWSKKQRSFTMIVASSLRQWLSYTISYLISSRDDMILGNFIYNAYESVACGNSRTQIQARHTIPNWNRPFNSTQNVQIRLFLSGIRSIFSNNGSFVSLEIKVVALNTTSGQITYILSNPNMISYLTLEFNFFIISRNNFKFDLTSNSLFGSGIITPQTFKTLPLYVFGGLSSYNSQKASNNRFAIVAFTQTVITCRGSKCPRSCVSKRQCLQRQGRIINNTRGNEQCLLECGNNQLLNALNQCECAYGFELRNGACTAMTPPVQCSIVQVYNFTTRRCECRSDFVAVGFGCLTRCNTNGFINTTTNRCQCLPGFRIFNNSFCHRCQQIVDPVNNKCTCYEPQFYMALNGSCIRSNCISNYYFILEQNRCRCLQNQVEVNGTCYNTCGIKQYTLRNTCVCVPGFTFVREKNGCFQKASCTKPNEIPDEAGYDCICRDGFQRDSQNVTCVVKCPENQILSLNKQSCECIQGFLRDPVTKLCTANCPNNEVYDRNVFSCRCKDGHVRDSTMTCVLQRTLSTTCNTNEEYSQSSQNCLCVRGFERNPQGVCQQISIIPPPPPKICPRNSTLKNNECICNLGFIKMGQTCISICGINEIYNEISSGCECSQGFGRVNNVCRACPQNSTTRNNVCLCSMGLKWIPQTNVCDISCQTNTVKTFITLSNSQTVFVCLCDSGFVQNAQGQCTKIPETVCPPIPPVQPPVTPPQNTISCPGSSVWDSVNFRCFCNSSSLFFINGDCQVCGLNQGWNGSSCVCSSGFNMINSKCLRCDINSVYRGGRCNCNWGFYDQNPRNIENTSCKACHASCGTCTGPRRTQCFTCANPQDNFQDGECTVSQNCPRGFFNSSSGCQKCSEYCNRCKNENQCTNCVSGFEIQKVQIFGIVSAFCPQICGDGRRFEYECDDGNLIDGDGCDSSCFIERGWTCNAGSPRAPSICVKSVETRAILTTTRPLRMIGQIIQGATLSSLPEALSQNLCVQCDDILLIRLISYTIQPEVKLSYIPTTRFKFTMNFTFSGIFAIPDFVYSVQINPKYEKYFTAEDMAQRLVIPVVPADLSLANDIDVLTLDDVLDPIDIA